MDTKGVGAVAALLLVGGFLALFGVLPTVSHHIAVQENQPTEATVQSTEVAVEVDDDGDRSYRPVVTYEYTVDGETYTEDNVFPGGFQRSRGDRDWAQGIVDQYEPGDRVTIHYRPGQPGHAYLRNDGIPNVWFVGLGCALLLAFGGVWLVKTGFRRRKQRVLMRDTPTEDVEALSVGPSEVKGSALAADGDPMTAPFSNDDCLVAKYEVEEYHDDDDGGGSWNTIESGVAHQPFLVDDGTGRVLVDPHDDATYDLDPADWETTYVDSSDRGPEPVRRYVETTDIGYPSDASGQDNDRRYRQNLIRDKESVYVYGTAQPREDDVSGGSNPERLVIRLVGEDDALEKTMFFISDDSETGLVSRREWAGWRLPAGGAFLVAALAVALFMFGPFLGMEIPVLF